MGVADRLIAAVTGAPGLIAPAGVPRETGTDVYDTDVNPADTKNKLRYSNDATFNSGTQLRDVRPGRVQVLTLTGYDAGEEFKLSCSINGQNLGDTIAFTHGTDAAASDLQTALRTLTGDTGLLVTGTTNTGPFTITHVRSAFADGYPKYQFVVVTAGVGGTFADDTDADEGVATVGLLGESHRVSETNTILKPTIGTITVTESINEVQSVTYSAGTDGGTVAYRLDRGGSTPDLRFDATAAEIVTALEEAAGTDGVPSVAVAGGEVALFDLADIANEDTFKVTYDSVASALITFVDDPDDDAAAIQAAINAISTIVTPEDEVLVTPGVSGELFTVTRARQGALASTFSITDETGFTPEGAGDFTLGVDNASTAAADGVVTFTFANGRLAGRPVGTKFGLGSSTALTDGGVAEAAVLAEVTAGVLGSISAAYTENGAGDTVLAAAVNDTTGKSYGFATDAASPVAVADLPPGAYHLILRTIEAGRVSKADSKAFTVAV